MTKNARNYAVLCFCILQVFDFLKLFTSLVQDTHQTPRRPSKNRGNPSPKLSEQRGKTPFLLGMWQRSAQVKAAPPAPQVKASPVPPPASSGAAPLADAWPPVPATPAHVLTPWPPNRRRARSEQCVFQIAWL